MMVERNKVYLEYMRNVYTDVIAIEKGKKRYIYKITVQVYFQ